MIIALTPVILRRTGSGGDRLANMKGEWLDYVVVKSISGGTRTSFRGIGAEHHRR